MLEPGKSPETGEFLLEYKGDVLSPYQGQGGKVENDTTLETLVRDFSLDRKVLGFCGLCELKGEGSDYSKVTAWSGEPPCCFLRVETS